MIRIRIAWWFFCRTDNPALFFALKPMGLDQYAYLKFGEDFSDFLMIGEWRKHPNLQGWMERLWRKKTSSSDPYLKDTLIDDEFNGIELPLELEDIIQLEEDISKRNLDGGFGTTTGFFFGGNSDEEYRWEDLKFCDRAKVALRHNHVVFYNSSW